LLYCQHVVNYNLLLGDPAKLHAQIRDHALDMTNVYNLSLAELKKLAVDVGISVSQKSKVYILM